MLLLLWACCGFVVSQEGQPAFQAEPGSRARVAENFSVCHSCITTSPPSSHGHRVRTLMSCIGFPSLSSSHHATVGDALSHWRARSVPTPKPTAEAAKQASNVVTHGRPGGISPLLAQSSTLRVRVSSDNNLRTNGDFLFLTRRPQLM